MVSISPNQSNIVEMPYNVQEKKYLRSVIQTNIILLNLRANKKKDGRLKHTTCVIKTRVFHAF